MHFLVILVSTEGCGFSFSCGRGLYQVVLEVCFLDVDSLNILGKFDEKVI